MARTHILIAILSVMLVSLAACETPEQAQERGLQIMARYLEIPSTADDIQAHYFQQGQWRSAYLKFSLPDSQLKQFLDINCFGQMKPYNSGRYTDFNITTVYRGTPEWWITQRTNLILEGSCTQNRGTYVGNLGIGIIQAESVFTVYVNTFM
ncbi:MAG: hypothetical protein ABI835_15440 [Chloroflexota bacterium]